MDTPTPPGSTRPLHTPPLGDGFANRTLASDASDRDGARLQTWATFEFAPRDTISYDLDPNTGKLTITVAMVPVRTLPHAASEALGTWLHEHLSPAAALTLEAELQQFTHQRVKLHALFAALTSCASTLPLPD